MKEYNAVSALNQLSCDESGHYMQEYIRTQIRQTITEVLEEEVSSLCGARHRQNVAHREYTRGGSAPGYVIIEGRKESINRCRVRQHVPGKGSKEVPLKTYKSLQDNSLGFANFLEAALNGVSTRDVSRVFPGGRTNSKNEISKLLKAKGQQCITELRSKDLSELGLVVLMLDGIVLSKDITAIAALGIDAQGRKHFLDFEIGSSESEIICTELCTRLLSRNIAFSSRRPLAVLDGSKALSNAVKKLFPGVIIQRCLVHKERNISARISKKYRGVLAQHFKEIRLARGEKTAKEAVLALRLFLTKRSAEAVRSLDEAGEELIALHCLDVAPSLYVTLLSTNSIENSFKNVRSKLGRVDRWRPDTDQPSQWMAIAMLRTQEGFRQIPGHAEMASLIEKLK